MPYDSVAPRAWGSQIGDYVLLHIIGEGSFGRIMLARHLSTNAKVAVKIMNHRVSARVIQEVQSLQSLNHPNVVRLFEVIRTQHEIYLFMEHVEGGDLLTHLRRVGRLPEPRAQALCRQLVTTVHYCHQRGVAHRDLKPENILLDGDMNIKLADFGFSQDVSAGLQPTFCGTAPYMAPELFRRRPHDGRKVDVWALGVVTFQMVTGALPFDGDTFEEVRRRVLAGHFQVPAWLSAECQTLLTTLLTADPSQRPTLENILGDPWLNRGQEEALQPYEEPPRGDLDPHIVGLMKEQGFEPEDIKQSVAGKKYDNIMGTYLILGMNIWGRKGTIRPCPSPEPSPRLSPACPSGKSGSPASASVTTDAGEPPAPGTLKSREALPPALPQAAEAPPQASPGAVGRPSFGNLEGWETQSLSREELWGPPLLCRAEVWDPPFPDSEEIWEPPFLSNEDIGGPPLTASQEMGEPSVHSSDELLEPPLLVSDDIGGPPLLASEEIGEPSLQSVEEVWESPSLICMEEGEPPHGPAPRAATPSPVLQPGPGGSPSPQSSGRSRGVRTSAASSGHRQGPPGVARRVVNALLRCFCCVSSNKTLLRSTRVYPN